MLTTARTADGLLPLLFRALMGLTVALTVAQPARAGGKDLTIERETERAASSGAADTVALAVSLWADRTDGRYAPGSAVVLRLKPNRDAYVTVVEIRSTGEQTVVFPNHRQADGHVPAWRTIAVGDPRDSATLEAPSNPGRVTYRVFASETPHDVVPWSNTVQPGNFRKVPVTSEARPGTKSLGLDRAKALTIVEEHIEVIEKR